MLIIANTFVFLCRTIMKRIYTTVVVAMFAGSALHAQSFVDTIAEYRKKYVSDLLADTRTPIKQSQVKDLDFYPPDPAYKIWAKFVATPGSVPFMVQTHSGKQKPFKEYGTLTFTLGQHQGVLHIYQGVDLVKNAEHKDDLFIMFNDETNYQTTYAGGRYIDLSVKDITDGGLWLDLNKSYNPYCAYADGFSCPIPPDENHLHFPVEAGEKMFRHL